ncbi:MAG TPA: AbrB/MazE/SpoVT family DNA-binding domain-containing protein [Acidisarcina sp.]
MPDTIITVSTKGQLVIPSEMRASLDIKPGSRIAISLDYGRIILQPVSERLVDETRGMLKGKPSLAAELQKQRRADKASKTDKW